MASNNRPKPEKIHSAGKCFWEGLLYVQEEKKPFEWKPRHAHLATLDKMVYLLIYTSKPQAASSHQKTSNQWTLHKVTADLDPRGFSTSDEANDVNHLCLQTKDPEGLQYVGFIQSPLARQKFLIKVKEALGEDKQSDRGAKGMTRANTAPPGGRPPNITQPYGAYGYQRSDFNLDSASMDHLRTGSHTADDESPSYVPLDSEYEEVFENRRENQSSSDVLY